MKSKFLKFMFAPIVAIGALAFSFGAINAPQKVEEASAWSGTQTCSKDASYYASCDNLYGAELAAKLATFNNPTSKSYDWSRYEAADEAENDSTSILSLYTRHTIKKNSHCGDYSWTTWNREHVFTQTAFPNSASDNHNIFACEGKINQIRDNDKFADLPNVSKTEEVFGHDTGCKSSGGKFEPCDAAKGEVARAVLYCTIYYGYSVTQIFDSLSTCLKWHAEHPVTAREIYRNNIVNSKQGNRNPFIDHPSYANKIYSGYTQYTQPDPIDGKAVISDIPLKNVSLDKELVNIAVGESVTLTPSFEPANATNKEFEVVINDYEVISYAKNNGVVTVTGRIDGTAFVVIKTNDGGHQALCKVIVGTGQKKGGSSGTDDDDDFLAGCMSSVAASSALISATSLLGFALLAIRKKKRK